MNENRQSFKDLVESKPYKNFMKKMEILALIAIALYIIMAITGFGEKQSISSLVITGGGTLLIIYFFFNFKKYPSESKIVSHYFYKIYGIGLSLGVINTLFMYLHFPMPYKIVSAISIVLLIVSLILGFKAYNNQTEKIIDWKFFARIALVLIPLAYFTIRLFVG